MTALAPAADAAAADRFARVVRRRHQARRMRAVEALVIAVLAWLGLQSPLVLLWFAATVAMGGLEARLSRGVLTPPATPGSRRRAALGQVLSALTYTSIAVLVMTQRPDATSLAAAAVVLCAVALSNAVQSQGSRLATISLVTPPAVLLTLCPFLMVFADPHAALDSILLLAAAGAAFAVFILRLSGSLHAKSEAVRRTGREAEAGAYRWRMIFRDSPMAHNSFDASALLARLQARARGKARLGDTLALEYPTTQALAADVEYLETNEAARALFDRLGPSGQYTGSYLAAFSEALNELGEDGVIPPFDAEFLRDDGETRVLRIHYRVTDGLGAPWSLCLGTYEDVTEARLAAQAQDEARKAAEEANRAKSDFLAVMSHEIRTPLNGVLGMAQAMDLDQLTAPQRDRLRVIRESGAALMDLLDDLLDISRIEAGRLTLDAHDFDLRAVVEGAHAAFAAEAAAKNLRFPIDVDPTVAGVWRGDSQRVRQILTNLISNALKFTHAGEVAVRLARSGAGVRLEVADTGIGMAPDRVARLFEKFVQADASATRAYGGTGLGLSICQELCRAMGGAISVSSAPGQGSTFAVELPLRQIERAPPGLGPLTEALGDGNLRVLAAEDNPVNRMVLKALLAQFAVEPTMVENGAEAVRAWESSHWDLILMDVQMPVMDGPTATMTIRAREAVLGRPRTPILAVTANTMAHQVASYRAAGMDDVVSKPLNVAELLAAMVAATAPAEAEIKTRAAS